MNYEDIRAEIVRLLRLQKAALDSATYSLGGMTRKNWLEYAQRQGRIRELRQQLRDDLPQQKSLSKWVC